jgi:hypothetical protein
MYTPLIENAMASGWKFRLRDYWRMTWDEVDEGYNLALTWTGPLYWWIRIVSPLILKYLRMRFKLRRWRETHSI